MTDPPNFRQLGPCESISAPRTSTKIRTSKPFSYLHESCPFKPSGSVLGVEFLVSWCLIGRVSPLVSLIIQDLYSNWSTTARISQGFVRISYKNLSGNRTSNSKCPKIRRNLSDSHQHLKNECWLYAGFWTTLPLHSVSQAIVVKYNTSLKVRQKYQVYFCITGRQVFFFNLWRNFFRTSIWDWINNSL